MHLSFEVLNEKKCLLLSLKVLNESKRIEEKEVIIFKKRSLLNQTELSSYGAFSFWPLYRHIAFSNFVVIQQKHGWIFCAIFIVLLKIFRINVYIILICNLFNSFFNFYYVKSITI